MKSIYGPVSSWRPLLQRSLGIDPICSENKICSFDCAYCQLGEETTTFNRQKFVDLGKIKKDSEMIVADNADVITFSGTGEPTLANNLGDIADYMRSRYDLPLAILTNSSLLSEKEVADVLYGLDIVVAKLDAPNEQIFRDINKPHQEIAFEKYLKGIKEFREGYSGKFALQMMFIDANQEYAEEMAELARELDPDEIHINTPLRSCASRPLSEEKIKKIEYVFSDLKNVISVYEAERPDVNPIDLAEVKKRKRPEA